MSAKSRLASLFFLVLAMLACSIQVPTVATKAPLPTVTATATKLPTVSVQAWTAEVELPTVNVRQDPNGKVVGALTAGDRVSILKCVGNWCQIKNPSGYVWRGCLSDNPEGLGCQAK